MAAPNPGTSRRSPVLETNRPVTPPRQVPKTAPRAGVVRMVRTVQRVGVVPVVRVVVATRRGSGRAAAHRPRPTRPAPRRPAPEKPTGQTVVAPVPEGRPMPRPPQVPHQAMPLAPRSPRRLPQHRAVPVPLGRRVRRLPVGPSPEQQRLPLAALPKTPTAALTTVPTRPAPPPPATKIRRLTPPAIRCPLVLVELHRPPAVPRRRQTTPHQPIHRRQSWSPT